MVFFNSNNKYIAMMALIIINVFNLNFCQTFNNFKTVSDNIAGEVHLASLKKYGKDDKDFPKEQERNQDKIYLRNGRMVEGRIKSIKKDAYTFYISDKKTKLERSINVPKLAVKYIIYGDTNRQSTINGVEEALDFYDKEIKKRKLGLQKHSLSFKDDEDNRRSLETNFLPTLPYAQSLIARLRSAEESIYIMTYVVSGTKSEPVKNIINILAEKAASGVDVRLITSQDAGTRQPVRVTNLREGKILASKGVQVKYSKGGRVMHKKVWIIDKKVVILGSSNLTQSSFKYGNNANIMIECAKFAHDVLLDFEDLWKKCKGLE